MSGNRVVAASPVVTIIVKERHMINKEQINQIVELAKASGAGGIWLLRGAQQTVVGWVPEGEEADDPLEIEIATPCELIFIARFPVGDGGQAGIEYY